MVITRLIEPPFLVLFTDPKEGEPNAIGPFTEKEEAVRFANQWPEESGRLRVVGLRTPSDFVSFMSW